MRVANGRISAASSDRSRLDRTPIRQQARSSGQRHRKQHQPSVRTAAGYPSTLYCRVNPPDQPDWKGLVSYPLPLGLNASATWQNRAGPQNTGELCRLRNLPDHARSDADVQYGLGPYRSLRGPEYADRLNQVDVRLSKSLKIGTRGRVQATVSVFNLFNANSTLVWNTTCTGRPADTQPHSAGAAREVRRPVRLLRERLGEVSCSSGIRISWPPLLL